MIDLYTEEDTLFGPEKTKVAYRGEGVRGDLSEANTRNFFPMFISDFNDEQTKMRRCIACSLPAISRPVRELSRRFLRHTSEGKDER